MSAVVTQNISKTFGSTAAVQDLSMSIPQGTLCGVIGPNGSGKTTTIRMIMNVILPDTGSIRVFGQESREIRRDRISYLPEERGLYKKLTIRQMLSYLGELRGISRDHLSRSIRDWVERMGLASYLDQKIENLSKGMSQKVQFMAAVIGEPELLILDEPFSGLDPVNAVVLREAVLSLKQRGVTILFSTHDMNAAELLCDRIVMIFRGKKVLDGSLRELQEQHGSGVIRVSCAGGKPLLESLSEVTSIQDVGNMQDLVLAVPPQQFLQTLANQTEVFHFEQRKPSLQDIFVNIAQGGSHA
jgi:ABC-2 type transport system ATP-binding protein